MPKKNTQMQKICSFCGRLVDIKDAFDMPIYDPSTGYALCADCIKHIAHLLDDREASSATKEKKNFKLSLEKLLEDNKPHLIKNHLDNYIVKQEHAKKILSVAIYNHFKRMYYGIERTSLTEIEKSNVIMLGPSGSGKTAMLKHLAQMLDIPFAVTDASSLTEAGFVGSDVEVAVRNLYYAADKDIFRTEHGIIYLDEFDKIARKSGENNSITADPGHEGVQQGLLKMLEGNIVEFTAQGMRKHPDAPTIKVNTNNILFIVGGAFVGIDKIIAKRLKKDETALGFGAKLDSKADEPTYDDLLRQVTTEDLIKFGIIPEMMGRLPVICTFETLDEEALLKILTEPINAPVRQYKELFSIDNVTLDIEKEALLSIARKAIERKTGARGLKSILEDTMLDIMFDIPRSNEKRTVTITADCINNHVSPLIKPITDKD